MSPPAPDVRMLTGPSLLERIRFRKLTGPSAWTEMPAACNSGVTVTSRSSSLRKKLTRTGPFVRATDRPAKSFAETLRPSKAASMSWLAIPAFQAGPSRSTSVTSAN